MPVKNLLIFTILFICLECYSSDINISLEKASVIYKENKIKINTGRFIREWQVLEHGLVTTKLKNLATGKKWNNAENQNCDWAYYGLIDSKSKAKLLSVEAKVSTDSGFTSPHILVEAEFEYTEVETLVKYEIRVYPNSDGVYTRVAFKGNPSPYLEKSEVKTGVSFNLIRGKENFDYVMNGFTEDYIANYTFGEEKIEYLIDGLDKTKNYKIGLSWWDFKGGGIKQDVSVSSVDGENTFSIFQNRKIHSHKDNQGAEEVEFKLPQETLLDGSFRLFIDRKKGEFSTLSEIWIIEEGTNEYNIAGNVDRVNFLQTKTMDGSSLMAYINCGERNKIEASRITGRVDFIPVDATNVFRHYVGYYNDTQHRNKHETPLIKELKYNKTVKGKENIEWASVLMAEDENDVLIMVKESHKCVNQYGHDTGDFEISKSGISNTGTSLMPDEILPDRYRYAWASWVITSENSDDKRQLALKRFERSRFPVNPETDIYIIANTWGSDRGIDAAIESNVLEEIRSQHELGIDVQQIDDGWQKNLKGKFASKWYPNKERFANGFKTVRKNADSLDLKLGLWFAAQPVSLQEMKDNYDDGRFSSYKLDFANIRHHEHIEEMIGKIRAYELYAEHKSKVNWDVTENAPRFGYFWAKEYGAVFLENRKPAKPKNVVYKPYLVLRDLWHLSKYCNLNKFQGTVQNIDMVNKDISDAYLHNHSYVTAIPLMSTPLFFQETQFYTPEAKQLVKELLSTYKTVRNDIYNCLVYPIGSEPNNASWAGFQAHHPDDSIGFITIFRELENNESKKNIQLRFIKNKMLNITNLITGKQKVIEVDKNGFVNFKIEKAADFRFFKYTY